MIICVMEHNAECAVFVWRLKHLSHTIPFLDYNTARCSSFALSHYLLYLHVFTENFQLFLLKSCPTCHTVLQILKRTTKQSLWKFHICAVFDLLSQWIQFQYISLKFNVQTRLLGNCTPNGIIMVLIHVHVSDIKRLKFNNVK